MALFSFVVPHLCLVFSSEPTWHPQRWESKICQGNQQHWPELFEMPKIAGVTVSQKRRTVDSILAEQNQATNSVLSLWEHISWTDRRKIFGIALSSYYNSAGPGQGYGENAWHRGTILKCMSEKLQKNSSLSSLTFPPLCSTLLSFALHCPLPISFFFLFLSSFKTWQDYLLPDKNLPPSSSPQRIFSTWPFSGHGT